ncbi:MAG: helix-turn-helix domain-containing protein [Actinomycetota bacterium]
MVEAGWSVDVSGVTAVRTTDGIAIDLRPKERAVVAAVALHHPATVSAAGIAALVWGDTPPATAIKAVHNHVARLRRSAVGLLETTAVGYRFAVGVEVAAPGTAASYHELADQPSVAAARADDRRRRLEEEEADSADRTASGVDDALLVHLDALVDAAPHRLDRWWLSAIARARIGQRRRALEIARSARRAIPDPTGRRALQRLETAIATDDLFLDTPSALRPESLGATADHHPPSIGAPGRTTALDPSGEISRLVDHLAGEVRLTLLVAPAGGGKSVAARRVIDTLPRRGWRCVATVCSPAEPDPTRPLVELLEGRRDREGSTAAEPTVSTARETSSTRDADIDDFTDRLVDELAAPSSTRTLLLLDDLHHASDETRGMVARLATRLSAQRPVDDTTGTDTRRHPVSLLVTSRHRVDEMSDAQVIDLHPWDRRAIRRYVTAFAAPGRWTDDAVDWIDAHASGSPLFVRELTIDVLRRRGGQLPSDQFAPPESVASTAALHRLVALPRGCTDAVECAAILGDVFDPDEVTRMTSAGSIGLAIAIAHGFIEDVGGGLLGFAHQTYRQAVLDRLDRDRTIELSRHAAAAVAAADRPSRVADIARLARAAASADPERAIRAALEHVDTARRAHRFEEALASARLAWELILEHEGRTVRWCHAGVTLGNLGVFLSDADAPAILVECAARAEELGAFDVVGRAATRLASIRPGMGLGRVDADTARFVEVSLAQVDEPRLRAQVCAAAAFSAGISLDPQRARDLFDEADCLSSSVDDPVLRGDVLLRAYTPLSTIHDVSRLRTIIDELHQAADQTGTIDYRYEAGRLGVGLCFRAGDGDPRVPMQTVERLAARLGQRGRNWSLFSFRSTIALLDGDMERAEQHADALLSPEVVVGDDLRIATHGALLLAIRRTQGRAHELDEAVAALVDEQPDVATWHAARALTAATVDATTAAASFDRIIHDDHHDLPPSFTLLPGLVAAADATVLMDDAERAARILPHLEPFGGWWATFDVGTFGPVDLSLARLHQLLGDRARAHETARRGLRSCAVARAPVFTPALAELAAGSHPSPGTTT